MNGPADGRKASMADVEQSSARDAKLQFHYIKGPHYIETACHGVLGGVTPNGSLWMAMFSERGPIPRVVEFMVTASDAGIVEFEESKATPSHVDTRSGVVRHIEVSTYLDVTVARKLRDWLGERIKEMEERL
jgi:hypothetical protein